MTVKLKRALITAVALAVAGLTVFIATPSSAAPAASPKAATSAAAPASTQALGRICVGTHVRRCVEILHPSSGGYRAWAKIADVQSDGVDYDVWVTDISLWRSYPVNRVRLERDQDGKFLEWDSGYTTLYNADGVCASAVFHWAPHGSSKVTTQTVYSNWA